MSPTELSDYLFVFRKDIISREILNFELIGLSIQIAIQSVLFKLK